MNTYLNVGLHAIGDPTRLAILQRLSQGPLAVAELTRSFEVSRPAISQHLRILKDAGLVTNRAHGTQRIYQIDPRGIEALKTHFDSLWTDVLANFQTAAQRQHPQDAADHTKEKRNVGHTESVGKSKRR